ncbi:Dos2-interacting transcription regulator of RNA-Pol-II-domain-containing protein [Xylariaceae sp. FL0016]|nr:Dos2-interacting transcription regulator of RNA-Pol-II-domain-containing protein [Xylariaceae sp. FL0016]
MAGANFNELALQYVLADEQEQQRDICKKAAEIIEEAPNSRVTIGQWVASINKWIHPDETEGDEDFIARAKALDFLAGTLEVLKRKDSTVKPDHVKLLVTFFGSLFSSDHRAGITASAKAIRHLTDMKAFQPSLGHEIIHNACKLGDDFKLQTPATRLELYELFLRLLQDPSVANDLEYRDGNTCGFMTGLLDLCRNERDPINLIKWFQILKTFLQNFSPSDDVTSEVFKTFSAYFPISLRASATPSGVTADDLKIAVRSCFAAHQRIAKLAIPYLINKLDQGDAVTVTVKVDILSTLDACLTQYEHPKQSVVPYVDQVWGSLKYEVRNGEVPDTIKATLKVLSSLAKRLDTDELRSFVGNAWRDLDEDLSNPNYAAQSGRLLVAIAGATVESFSLLAPQTVAHIQMTVKHNKSVSHVQQLLKLLSSILMLRSHLADASAAMPSQDRGDLKDAHFGESLFHEIYLPLWQEYTTNSAKAGSIEILKEVIDGAAALIGQKSSGVEPRKQLCADSICERVIEWLAESALVCPLEARTFFDPLVSDDKTDDFTVSALEAMKKAVSLYPPTFQHLLLQFISSLKTTYRQQPIPEELGTQIQIVGATLCDVCNSAAGDARLLLSNQLYLIDSFLECLHWLLSERSDPKYWAALVCALRIAIIQTLASVSGRDSEPSLTRDSFASFEQNIAQAVSLESSHPSSFETVTRLLQGTEVGEADDARQRINYCLWVTKHLYTRFTIVSTVQDERGAAKWTVELARDFSSETPEAIAREDICLHQLALLATEVIRSMSEDEQRVLQLDQAAFTLFHPTDIEHTTLGLDSSNGLRAAPLSMGVLQGLWPAAISPTHHENALNQLCMALTSAPSTFSDLTRAALDTTLAILVNKLRLRGQENLKRAKKETQRALVSKYNDLSNMDAAAGLRIFRSILHYLAGDVARFQGSPDENLLLTTICRSAPLDPAIGRQLAQNLEVLVSPKECLDTKNHAQVKKLSGSWLFSQVVSPYLSDCFPKDGMNELQAVNRAVATFAITKHLKLSQFADDIGKVVRIAIRSLSTFDIGVEMESCLSVILQILEQEPAELKEHLSGLITAMTVVYKKASDERGRAATRCRKFTLEFFQRLPSAYEARYLLPHRQLLLRPLSSACGDSVRDIRRIALRARQAWADVD